MQYRSLDILPFFKKACLLSVACFALDYSPAFSKDLKLTDEQAMPAMIGEVRDHDADYEDTFVHLARDHGLGFVEMRAANPGVDPWVPGAGEDLVLPTAHLLPNVAYDGIVINIPEMRIYSFIDQGGTPQTFPIGIGREGLETPKGKTKIVRKKNGPTWRPTARMRREDPELEAVVPAGPDNPLGTHALYLGWPEYLIHGTNKPFGIGRRISSGCIRMYPEDIVKLFEMTPVGTKVQVIDQPIKMAWVDDKLMIEAHPTEQQAMMVEQEGHFDFAPVPDKEITRLIEMSGDSFEGINWDVVRKVYGLRLGYPIAVAQKITSTIGVQDDKQEGVEGNEDILKPLSFSEKVTVAEQRLRDIYDAEEKNPSDKM